MGELATDALHIIAYWSELTWDNGTWHIRVEDTGETWTHSDEEIHQEIIGWANETLGNGNTNPLVQDELVEDAARKVLDGDLSDLTYYPGILDGILQEMVFGEMRWT